MKLAVIAANCSKDTSSRNLKQVRAALQHLRTYGRNFPVILWTVTALNQDDMNFRGHLLIRSSRKRLKNVQVSFMKLCRKSRADGWGWVGKRLRASRDKPEYPSFLLTQTNHKLKLGQTTRKRTKALEDNAEM